jgi:hypothetical protein
MKPHVEFGLGFLAGVVLQGLLLWGGLALIGPLAAGVWIRPVGTLCATAACVAARRTELAKGLLLAAIGFAIVSGVGVIMATLIGAGS